jgi:hypothetical protein
MDDSRVVTPEAPLRPAMGEDGKYCDYLGPNLIVHNGIPEVVILMHMSPLGMVPGGKLRYAALRQAKN